MSYNKKKLETYLATILENTTKDAEKFDENQPYTILPGGGSEMVLKFHDGRSIKSTTPDDGTETLYVLGEGLKALNSFIQECLKDTQFALQIGEKALADHLNKMIRNFYGDKSIKHEEVVKHEILKTLRSKVEKWQVRVPLACLGLNSCITIGDIEYQPHEIGVVHNTKRVIDHKGPAEDPNRGLQDQSAFLKVLNEISQQGSAWDTFEVESHEQRIVEVARQKLEAGISLIRAFTHVFTPYDLRYAFGMPYELAGSPVGFMASHQDRISITFDRKACFVPFSLNDQVLTKLREICNFEKLALVCSNQWEELNSIEQATRVATLWLSRSVVPQTRAESFTHCMIALERLLIVDGEISTTEKLSERLSLLIADDVDQRKAFFSLSKRLYELRSKIVHSGFDAIELSQLQEIEHLTLSALVKCSYCLDDYTTHEELKEMLYHKKMS